MKPPVLLIGGPTAVGKTSVALQLAECMDGEIICADSLTVYHGFTIGSAKPNAEEQARVPHHLLDIRNPEQPFSVSDFLDEAHRAIRDIQQRGKKAIVVGGTGLYLRALATGLCEAPGRHDEIRETLQKRYIQEGAEVLHKELSALDPILAPQIHPHHTQRLIRALEVVLATGKPLSSYHREQQHAAPYTTMLVCLTRPRQELYARINQRVEQMVACGLLDEVRRLLEDGVSPHAKPMQTIGYCECCQHLLAGTPWDVTVQKIQQHTRQFAKRQLTWFRREQDCQWFFVPDDEERLHTEVVTFFKQNSGEG